MHWCNRIKTLNNSLRAFSCALNGTSSFCDLPSHLIVSAFIGLSISWSCSQLVIYQRRVDTHQVKYLSWWRPWPQQTVWMHASRTSGAVLSLYYVIFLSWNDVSAVLVNQAWVNSGEALEVHHDAGNINVMGSALRDLVSWIKASGKCTNINAWRNAKLSI